MMSAYITAFWSCSRWMNENTDLFDLNWKYLHFVAADLCNGIVKEGSIPEDW